MAQSLIACPLCSSASFSTTSALCLSLINVASKWLRCTLCEEELRGLDKLTIHLLTHLIHTAEFKKILSYDNAVSTSSATVLNPEPLNLVKSQSEQSSDEVNTKPTTNTYNSFGFQSKAVCNGRSERPSLKIDDEVMIFFNSTVKDAQNIQRACESERSCEVSPAIELPKFTINFTKDFDKHSEVNLTTERKNAIDSDEYFDVTQPNQVPQFLFTADPTVLPNCTNKDRALTIDHSESQMDLSSVDKGKGSAGCLIETISTPAETKLVEPDVFDDVEKQTLTRSSFLSPKGERVMGYRCDICSLVFPDEHILSMHRQLIHVEVNDGSPDTKSYKCHLCSKSFVMKGSLMVHMRVAHFGGAVVARLVESKQLESDAVSPDSAQFVCSVCNKGFRKEQQLTQHEKLHDGKQCDICLKTFTTKYFLRKHKRLHTGEMPYSCNVCNKSFTFQQSYHKHLLYHSDDKPYTCAECGRAFKELSTLHNHQRIHTGEKPFSCETCGKCFRQRVSYLVHRRIHTGDMPYRCQDCGKTFRYKVSERTHKCAVSTPGGNADTSDTSTADGSQDVISPSIPRECTEYQSNPGANSILEKEWHQKLPLEGSQTVAGEPMMGENYPEPTDFFSLVMSPSDRLQHLSLTAEAAEESSSQPEYSNHDSIDTEALKQLLYDVADYN